MVILQDEINNRGRRITLQLYSRILDTLHLIGQSDCNLVSSNSHKESLSSAAEVAQWQHACLACTKPWVWFSITLGP